MFVTMLSVADMADVSTREDSAVTCHVCYNGICAMTWLTSAQERTVLSLVMFVDCLLTDLPVCPDEVADFNTAERLSLIHISEPTRLA